MPRISSVAVFCGSRLGNDPAYAMAAQELGTGLARGGLRLVYGGGRNGLMGVLADAALAAGGAVLGVIPDFLTKWEVAHDGLTETLVTSSMHARKQRMADESDAFVSLPGGIGTLDETIEIISWRQLRQLSKPIFICDVAGSAAPLEAALNGVMARGFVAQKASDLFTVVRGVSALLPLLARAVNGPESGCGQSDVSRL